MSVYEEDKIPFDLDDMVSVNLMTLKNVVTYIMNKVTKSSKINNQLLDSNNELRSRINDLEKKSLENKVDGDIVHSQMLVFMKEQK
jgi:hypothetical protein